MTPDLHGLISQMAAELDRCQQLLLDDRRVTHALATEARAVLDRWGHQPAPVPASERLPGLEDCDAEDSCWWFDPHADGAWYMDTYMSCYTHWLPAHALPTPDATDD